MEADRLWPEPRSYRSGGSVAGTWVESDALICQKLISLIEDKRFMFEAMANEVPDHVRDSVQQLRVAAVAAQDAPDSATSRKLIKEIGAACRGYITAVDASTDHGIMEIALLSLRKQIGRNCIALVERYSLVCGLDLSDYRESGIIVLQQWLDKGHWDLDQSTR